MLINVRLAKSDRLIISALKISGFALKNHHSFPTLTLLAGPIIVPGDTSCML